MSTTTTTLSEEDRTIIRKRILMGLRAADPQRLKPARLLGGLEYIGYKLTVAELTIEMRALIGARLADVEEDALNAAESRYGFTEAGRVYLSREGV